MRQNQLLEEALIEIRLGQYGIAPASALIDPGILPGVRNYKRQVASQMMPLDRDDISRKIPDAEYYVSRKIDGEFSVLVFKDGDLITVNPGGTVRVGLPWQMEAKELLDAAGVKEAFIAGELYADNTLDRRPRVHDIVSVARQPNSEQELTRIKFAVFDVISIDGELPETNYAAAWKRIASIFQTGKSIHPVETKLLKTRRDIENQFKQWVDDENAEGLVVRSETAGNFKIKLRHNLDAVVIGFTESSDDRQGMLHDLLLGVTRSDGSIQVLCRVGGGFTEENRREMLCDLQDSVVESEYAEVNSDHVAYQMVKPKWVIEISCLDMIGQNTRGGPVNRMVLNWNANDSRYEVVRRLPLVSVISPQFIRIRDDKQFNKTDVRLSQVTDLLPILQSDVDAAELTMAKSTMLQREVYVKQLRGEMLVRKFLLWKTNKDGDSNEFPAYVANYIDFSPNRKVPLIREVRVSNSESQIRTLYRAFKDDNIKKGWDVHSSTERDYIIDLVESKKSVEETDVEIQKKSVPQGVVKKSQAVKKPTKRKSTKKSDDPGSVSQQSPVEKKPTAANKEKANAKKQAEPKNDEPKTDAKKKATRKKN